MRKTSNPLIALFIVTMLVSLGTQIFILYAALSDSRFFPTRIWLTGFGIFTPLNLVLVEMVLNILTIATGVWLKFDFENGLAEIFLPGVQNNVIQVSGRNSNAVPKFGLE